jgi:hypothetical protein
MAKATQPVIPTPQKTMVKAIVEGLMDKRLGEYLNAWIPHVHGALKCEMALLTIQYDPNRIKPAQKAWEEVSRLEKTVVDILGMEEDTLYVVSTVEMHSGRKKKGKGKKEGKEKEEVKEEILSVKTKEDVKGVFKKYNEKMEYEPGEEYLPRMYGYLKSIEGEGKELEMVREVAKLEEMKGGKEASETIYQITIGMINGRKVKIGGESEEVTLKGYPHIHMAIAFTTTTGVIRDLRTIAQKVLTYAHDVDIRKKDGTSMKVRRGRKVDISNDGKVLGYVFKNARHEETAKALKKYPTTIYNYRNNGRITELYTAIYNNTAVIMSMDTNAREKIEVKETTIKQEITKTQTTSEQTNLAATVTNKPIVNTKLMQMLNMVETYLERNQMAITPRGTIYQRIAESKKSWRYWGTPGEMYKKLVNKETVGLLSKTKKDYEEYTSGGYEEILPYVKLNFMWIEFKDFYYYIPTSEIVKKTEEEFKNECFAYCPEIKYEQVYPELKVKPVEWLKILENSGYIREEELTEEGKLLVKGVYGLMMPKTHKSKGLALYGESNSGKSSIIEPITALYPQDVILRLTDAGGFGLARMVGKPQIVISEEHHKGRLRRDQELMLLEGNINMSVDIKHKTDVTVYIEARTVFICNERDWAHKQNLLMGGQKGGTGPVSGQEIISEEVIDEAYANRLIFTEMRKIPPGRCSHEKREEMIEKEKGIIPLYTAKQQFGENAFKEMGEII